MGLFDFLKKELFLFVTVIYMNGDNEKKILLLSNDKTSLAYIMAEAGFMIPP